MAERSRHQPRRSLTDDGSSVDKKLIAVQKNALLDLLKYLEENFTDRRRYCGFISPLHGFPNGIALEVGRPKNSKKDLFSEHDIEEHGLELLNICPEGDPASLVTLWLATAVVNTHIRSVRPYARERHVLTQLRLLTGEYLATDLTKVTLNQILSQTTFQAFIPGLPA